MERKFLSSRNISTLTGLTRSPLSASCKAFFFFHVKNKCKRKEFEREAREKEKGEREQWGEICDWAEMMLRLREQAAIELEKGAVRSRMSADKGRLLYGFNYDFNDARPAFYCPYASEYNSSTLSRLAAEWWWCKVITAIPLEVCNAVCWERCVMIGAIMRKEAVGFELAACSLNA